MKTFFTKSVYIAFLFIICAWNLNAQEMYNITSIPNPPQGGIVIPGGTNTFPSGHNVFFVAIPYANWQFVNWTEDGVEVSTDDVYGYAVTGNHTLSANFVLTAGQITLTALPFLGGTVSGAGVYEYGTDVAVTATPNPNYEFLYWTDEEGVFNYYPIYYVHVTGDLHLIAHFAPAASFDVTVSANPAEYGTVSGGGTYLLGSITEVTAEPNPDFLFLNWTENGNIVSTSANYSFAVTGPRNLVANFVPATIEITLSKNIEEGGELFGAGIYPYGETVLVYATENRPEYFHSNWTENGQVISGLPGFTFKATQSRHFVANFIPAFYSIPVYADPIEGGTVTGGGTFPYGASVTIVATAKQGYQLLNWTKYVLGEGTIVSTTPHYSFEVTGDVLGNCAFVAYFKKDATVTITMNMPEGEVLGAGTYHYGDEVTVEAIPHTGYKFVNWSEGRGVLSTDNPYSFTVTEDRALVANFEEALSIEVINAGAMMLYPNPTNGDMKVVLNDNTLKIVEMELYDYAGKKVQQQNVNQPTGTLQMNDLPTGTYILKVYLDQGDVVVWKVMKN